MKNVIGFIFMLALSLVLNNNTQAQCYRCDNDSISWETVKKGPTKQLKEKYPAVGKINWYWCELGYFFAVEYFADSSKTYLFSEDKRWLGTETRYRITVPRYYHPDLGPDSSLSKMVERHGPDILPKTLHGLVQEVFSVADLDTLNKTDGMQYWVCDIFRVELPKSHPMSYQEKTTTFYVVSMDFVFHIYTKDREVILPNDMTNHGFLYLETSSIYETEYSTPATLPVED